MSKTHNPFGARGNFETASGRLGLYRLEALEKAGTARLDDLPVTIRLLLENLLRSTARGLASEDDVTALAAWGQEGTGAGEFPYAPRA